MGGIQVPFPREGIITLHPIERWHVEYGSRWMGTNKAKLYEILWENPSVAKVQLHYLKAKKYHLSPDIIEEYDNWTWVSDDFGDNAGAGETSSDSEIISALSDSSVEDDVVVEGGNEAARKRAERQAKAAKKKATTAKKTSAAREAADEQRARKANNASRKAAGLLYLSKRGTHWGIDPNGESEALALVKEAAALKKAKNEHRMRKADRARAADKAKAAEKAAKKSAARGDEAGMQMTHSAFYWGMGRLIVCKKATTKRPKCQIPSPPPCPCHRSLLVPRRRSLPKRRRRDVSN